MIFKNLLIKSINYRIFIVLYFPVFFIDNLWDGEKISYGFSIKNLAGIKTWYLESSSNLQYYVIKFLFF